MVKYVATGVLLRCALLIEFGDGLQAAACGAG
jgi:hypothetical protein